MNDNMIIDMKLTDSKNLLSAKEKKNDEFYTLYEDIESEVLLHSEMFKDKVVYCPCDNHNVSNFSKFFRDNFEKLGIKRLISTCYPQGFLEVVDKDSSKKLNLRGDGDFRSDECQRIMKNSDIVVTNPPFSLFREFVQSLMSNNLKFLIVGNKNAVQYKEIINEIINGEIWNGYKKWSDGMWFLCKDDEVEGRIRVKNGQRVKNISAIWFTNFDRPIMPITFDTKLSFEEGSKLNLYQKYDDSEVINVGRTEHIPMDYDGEMGVPITFLDKYNPQQFKLLGLLRPKMNGKSIYTRLLIRKRK